MVSTSQTLRIADMRFEMREARAERDLLFDRVRLLPSNQSPRCARGDNPGETECITSVTVCVAAHGAGPAASAGGRQGNGRGACRTTGAVAVERTAAPCCAVCPLPQVRGPRVHGCTLWLRFSAKDRLKFGIS
jgi:hypothetical protein